MKRYIRSSEDLGYTKHYIYNYHGNHNFSIYSKYDDDPENFQCQISEIKPYDLANYYSIKKDYPDAASLIRNSTMVGALKLRKYIEDDYEDPNEYINDIIDYLCSELIKYNRRVRPRINRI